MIVSVGRLEPAKGYETLIRALPEIVRAVPSAQVIIGGQGFLKERLLELAESTGLKDRVHFIGFRDEVRDILESGDIYVQSSLCDAFPYTLLEAIATGLPAITTSVGGMPEIVKTGENGIVVPRENPAALAAAVVNLANDDDMRVRFGQRGRTRVEKDFGISTMLADTFELYRRLAHENTQNRKGTEYVVQEP